MQAVILAAGMGKRLKELTANATKCMVEVNGITLIERALTQLDTLHLSKIILVVGYKGAALVEFVKSLTIATPIEFITNTIYDTTNNIYSLFLAREHLLEEDTLLLESDLIFDLSVVKCLVDDPCPNLALVAKYESWMDGTVVTVGEDNKISDFLNKTQFKFCDTETYYKTVNIYKFSKGFSGSHYVPFLEAYCKALGNNEYYEQVLKVISLLDDTGIKAKILGEQLWYEIDDIQDLDIAESLFTNTTEERLTKISKRFGGYWRYPKLLDFCYLVNPYYPPTRLLDEIKANFERLIHDYPSGQETNALLAAKYFNTNKEQTVVGNGAAELIRSLMNQLQGPMGIIQPTFDEYRNRFDIDQTVTYTPEQKDFSYSVSDIIGFFSQKKIGSLVVINPDNPSGNLIPWNDMLILLSWAASKNITLIVDESFIDFSDSWSEATILKQEILEQYANVVIIKSISKSYGVPGLRLGVLFSGDRELIQSLKRDVSIWNINSFAEFFLQIWEKYRSDYYLAMDRFRAERERFFELLETFPMLRPIPSQANYMMCEVTAQFSASEITTKLLEKNILIKDLSKKQGITGEYVRIAIKREEENLALMKALHEIIS
ncbi:MAG: aminotransferase [Firmicutes bacterium HGW-Firmicutes-15]|jgi:histidinol-phosphate/aromatic aminotransferase/cobyric acid decarboxylase-like protein|nr:MAG: aminotransferase [Spirochaetae bacterium HGW-Spirochaetae-2]PKM75905.1 MAG: aminotransferase [Firmicutes bacterium HGW-Firmicutes-15]